MEGVRVSKLKEGQQWAQKQAQEMGNHWGRRPPFIGPPESNCYVLSPHTSGTTAPRAVLPLRWKKQGKGGSGGTRGEKEGEETTTVQTSGRSREDGGVAADREARQILCLYNCNFDRLILHSH